MEQETKTKIIHILNNQPAVKLGYFFGSRARNEAGPLSDYDFAVYLDGIRPKEMFDVKFVLQDELSRLLVTDKIDVVILNLTESPELKYAVISEGELIYATEPYQLIVEPKILNEYFDFRTLLLRYNLTTA